MDISIFAQLQAVSTLSEETTIDTMRLQLNELVQWWKDRDDYLELVSMFADEGIRNLDVDTLVKADSFMVQDDWVMNELPEKFQHDSLGFCEGDHCLFQGRYVYPVKDVKGNVMGFCGYDMFSPVKYLDSHNYGYRAKTYSLYGMEELPNYYRSNEPVYFVEGIVCCLYLRQNGLQALAWLGSSVSSYVTEIIKRFGSRAIAVCDSDEAGTKCRRALRYKIPTLRCVQSRIAKDVDDSRKVDPNFVVELAKLKDPFYTSSLFS